MARPSLAYLHARLIISETRGGTNEFHIASSGRRAGFCFKGIFKMLNTPFSPWPSFTEEEACAVHDVLLSNKVNYWTGQHGRELGCG